ncbi:MAG TPA: cytochrome b/b6 domain-containing protein [Caulobacteraceae bacterium]|jgi:thiosulfate reductase cytochrome b subunit|nr:cytochrome b/b6 domain-containing protein [Caulobacteraceae bacterium]
MSSDQPAAKAERPKREVIYRHTLVVRITHWINLACISLLLMSGLQIFNAHPRLYWGQYGGDADKPFVELVATGSDMEHLHGVTRIAGHPFDTTGVLGLSSGSDHTPSPRGFPAWATLPSFQDLAVGRRWHFALAWLFVINGLTYLGFGLFNRHFSRDLAPTRDQLKPRHILMDIWDHMRLKHPRGEAAKSYKVLQKLTYLIVVFVLLPLMLATGLTMSPGFDAVLPGLLDLFGGRQSARTIHFISASLIVLFVLVHVIEVFLAGVINELRSMITGRYVVPPEAGR